MSAAPAKFTFDLDMGRKREKTQMLPEKQLAAMLQDARKQGFAEGYAQGEKGEVARTAQAVAAAAEKIAQQAAAMAAASDTMRKEALGEAIRLGAAVGRKIAAHLVAREPAAELEALIAECLGSIDHAPHLVIRCHPDLAGTVREIAEQRMATSGFAGRLVVMGEPDIALGDGRIEWVDGGLVRDTAGITAEIDKCIDGYMNANGIPAAGGSEQ